jgi:hypothetical protein
MLKRTKGRILLTLLVITGLAGTLNDSALTAKERKFAVNHFKDSKNELLKNVKGLSEEQLNFKATPTSWSIVECFYHITLTEKGLWGMFESNMKGAATPEKRSLVKNKDEEIPRLVNDRTNKVQAPEPFRPDKATWKDLDDAMTEFKKNRNEHIKYVKTTTEDLRNHVFELPGAVMDGYQMLLFIAAHSERHTQQIKEIKANPGFPK